MRHYEIINTEMTDLFKQSTNLAYNYDQVIHRNKFNQI